MLFSIIIPVYNVENYLDECLLSVLTQIEQIKEECEILLIDDGSTDASGSICDKYQKEFPKTIKVFHNTNRGLLLTRRFGFKYALGNYVINCDSDDLLEDGAIKKLQDIVKKYDFPDIVIFNHNRYNGKNKTIAFKDIFTIDKDCTVSKDAVLKEYLSRHSIVSMWGKIVKRSCIDLDKDYSEFGRISTGEDTLQSIEFFCNAEKYVYLNDELYNYRCGSGMTGKFDEKYYFTFKTIFVEIRKQRNSWNLEEFDKLLAIKVLQTTGRAITQSRYNKWSSLREHKYYLKKIKEDSMLCDMFRYLDDVRDNLQKDHFILLKLLQKKAFILICLMLKIKNIMG